MTSLPQRISSSNPQGQALHDSTASRSVEAAALAATPPFTLMARAGADAARLARALVPHAHRVWVAAGPGNNGGDGLVAATWLHQAGLAVRVSLLADAAHLPQDAARALQQAQAAGVPIDDGLAEHTPDLAIDALLGLGQRRAPEGRLAEAVRRLNALGAPVLALDLPTGLCADTGLAWSADVVRASATLSLLTLKPGLFTGQGREMAGDIWWSALGTDALALPAVPATAWLSGADAARAALPRRPPTAHKGRFGDLWVIGGAAGMGGAARLAARAALAAGAGRVYLCRLDDAIADDPQQPELMHRRCADWQAAGVLEQATVVCGCGGGDAVRRVLPAVLHRAARLVLDADALNAIAADPALALALQARGRRTAATVLTPHPLEAARLLATGTAQVQADRLAHARQLAQAFGAVTVLKGSGSVIAAPACDPVINASGNARLASAGTGDVLAGWLGGIWAQQPDMPETAAATARQAALAATWLHGCAAERNPAAGSLRLPLTAAALIQQMTEVARQLA